MLPEEILKETPKRNTYREDTIDRITRDMKPINSARVKMYLEKYFPWFPYLPYYRRKIELFKRK